MNSQGELARDVGLSRPIRLAANPGKLVKQTAPYWSDAAFWMDQRQSALSIGMTARSRDVVNDRGW
jgi:hypothetical protein